MIVSERMSRYRAMSFLFHKKGSRLDSTNVHTQRVDHYYSEYAREIPRENLRDADWWGHDDAKGFSTLEYRERYVS